MDELKNNISKSRSIQYFFLIMLVLNILMLAPYIISSHIEDIFSTILFFSFPILGTVTLLLFIYFSIKQKFIDHWRNAGDILKFVMIFGSMALIALIHGGMWLILFAVALYFGGGSFA